jgi:hypothetical protein
LARGFYAVSGKPAKILLIHFSSTTPLMREQKEKAG